MPTGIIAVIVTVAAVVAVILILKKRQTPPPLTGPTTSAVSSAPARGRTAAAKPARPPSTDPPRPAAAPAAKSGSGLSAPAWTARLGPQRARRFLELVGAYFQKRGISIEVDGGNGTVKADYPDQPDLVMGLQNIADICAQLEESKWGLAIADHFQKSESGLRAGAIMAKKVGNFEEVKGLIHAKLYDRDYIRVGPLNLVFREAMPGTVEVLVYDLPDSIQNVHPDQVEQWGKSDEELFQLGYANVRKNYPPEIRDNELDGHVVKVIMDDTFFATSHALLIEHYPELLGKHGAVLGVPHSSALICYPINDLNVLKVIYMLIQIVKGMHDEGPRSISDQLFWYHDQKYVLLPYQFEEGKLTFMPPPEFVDLLNALAPTEKGELSS